MTSSTAPASSLLWKRYLFTSFFWGVISGIALLVGLLQSLLPAALEGWPLLGHPLLPKIGSHLLLFGAAFPWLFGLWLRRFQCLYASAPETPGLFLWEMALPVWNGALLWGGIGGFWGEITERSGLLWTYPIYSFFLLAAALILAAVWSAIPRSLRKDRSPAFLSLFFGLWALIFLLAYALLAPLSSFYLSEAAAQTILWLALLLPSLGLLLPLSKASLLPSDLSIWRAFFFVFVLSSPFLAALFSSAVVRLDLPLLFAFLLLPFAGRFLFLLALWWGEPKVWLRLVAGSEPSLLFPAKPRSPALRLGFDPLEPSRSFLLPGLGFFALALLEIAAFASLRIQGFLPEPSWLAGQQTLWLAAFGFWLFGLRLASEPSLASDISRLRLRWWLAILGVLALFFGHCIEIFFSLFLQQASFPRGILLPPFAFLFHLAGSISLFVAFALGFQDFQADDHERTAS